jgi:hypothetical protein
MDSGLHSVPPPEVLIYQLLLHKLLQADQVDRASRVDELAIHLLQTAQLVGCGWGEVCVWWCCSMVCVSWGGVG